MWARSLLCARAMKRSLLLNRSAWLVVFVAACGQPVPSDSNDVDLPLGDAPADDVKADGTWGAALTCKPIPNLPRLVEPAHHHLARRAHAAPHRRGDRLRQGLPHRRRAPSTPRPPRRPSASRSPTTRSSPPASRTSPSRPRADPVQDLVDRSRDRRRSRPVFAGLPFMSWYGSYAIHGPIDNFRAPNGGTLRRGFVSHGCIRMEAADVLELYGRIKGLASVPVHVQREPERRADGSRVDLPSAWIGAECGADCDCNFTGGFCQQNRYSERGFCSARCTGDCADRPASPTTFCVADPTRRQKGMCVPQADRAVNRDCRPYDHFVRAHASRASSQRHRRRCACRARPAGSAITASRAPTARTAPPARAPAPTLPASAPRAAPRYCPDEPGWPCDLLRRRRGPRQRLRAHLHAGVERQRVPRRLRLRAAQPRQRHQDRQVRLRAARLATFHRDRIHWPACPTDSQEKSRW